MAFKSLLESALSPDHLHLLRLVADVAGSFGFPIYIVGGSVRDLMLGRVISDFDLTVQGDAGKLAESILRRLGGNIITHSKFGTARWTLTETTFNRLNVPVFQADNFPPFLDFVSARSETYPSPGELPRVKRASIEEDLRRRDFTINAMAIRLDGFHFGELIDPLNGQADLGRGLIRVLHPNSFIDDPTRMFRAVRYANRYELQIESETLALINEDALNVLARLSGERLRHEFDLIFEEERPLVMLGRLEALGLPAAIHPALKKAETRNLAHLKVKPDEDLGRTIFPDMLSFHQTLGWILYLILLSESEIEAVSERLAFPALLTKALKSASALNGDLDSFKNWKPSQWTFHLDELPTLSIFAVYLLTHETFLHTYLAEWQHIKPKTNGNDLKQLGLEPGPKYKKILSRLRAAWLDGQVKNIEEEKSLLDDLIAN